MSQQLQAQQSAGKIPELEPHCGSWMVTSPAGDIRELFERGNAERALAAGWRVETAAQYLSRINRAVLA